MNIQVGDIFEFTDEATQIYNGVEVINLVGVKVVVVGILVLRHSRMSYIEYNTIHGNELMMEESRFRTSTKFIAHS